MKKTIFLQLLLLTTLVVFSQSSKQVSPAWGHYKKLSAYSAKPTKGMETFDTLHFILASGETKVEHIERNGGPSAEKTKVPESKCDPATCQPAEVIGNGKKKNAILSKRNRKVFYPGFSS